MAENTIILRLDNVSKSFAKVEHDEVTHALNEVSLSMKTVNLSVSWGRLAAGNPPCSALWPD